MDPVSHLLFGQTLALTIRPPRASPGIGAALVLGSILPDGDVALALGGFDLYLRAHASGTHTLLGSFVEALVLALVLGLLLAAPRLLPLLIASWVGIVGHIVCDMADGSDLNVLKPFSDAIVGWHLVAMGEPIVLSILGAAALVAWRWPARARQTASAALVLLAIFLATKKTTQEWARTRYTESVLTRQPEAIAIAPHFGSLFAWTIYDRVGDQVRAWDVDTESGTTSLAFDYHDAVRTPAVTMSRELPVVRTFLGFSKVPFVRVEQDGSRRLVLWSDMSACSNRGCDLSFGGAFDVNTAPLYQLIRIGGFSQQRPLPVPWH